MKKVKILLMLLLHLTFSCGDEDEEKPNQSYEIIDDGRICYKVNFYNRTDYNVVVASPSHETQPVDAHKSSHTFSACMDKEFAGMLYVYKDGADYILGNPPTHVVYHPYDQEENACFYYGDED